jgi:hypothetical protein
MFQTTWNILAIVQVLTFLSSVSFRDSFHSQQQRRHCTVEGTYFEFFFCLLGLENSLNWLFYFLNKYTKNGYNLLLP